ncbi:MAG: D-alanyl-D-alanine carboxypeptidase [Thermaerobacter sp.]|nr:D-alanyl-D-alanine carboxypeptidase [Thermaerobacter sp.]
MRVLRVFGVLVLIVVLLAVVQMVRGVPAPSVSLQAAMKTVPGPSPRLPWPTSGEAAVAVQGIGSMGSYGGNAPMPIGSVAKVMTALLVLEKHPLSLNQQGPSITMTQADVQTYQQDAATHQSYVAVAAGEQLTEYQLLEGLLVPSGNNFAQILARWVGGSQAQFVQMMNAKAKSLGLKNTTYADASGLSPSTVSTAGDQLKLAEVAMQNPVFTQIVAEPQVILPSPEGLVYNYNKEIGHTLGKDTVIGVKTGSTLAAGGCYIFAMQRNIAGRNVIAYGAVFGAGGLYPLDTAISEGTTLGTSALNAVMPVRVVQSASQVGSLSAPWQGSVGVQAAQGVQFYGWGGLPVKLSLKAKPLKAPLPVGSDVGQLRVQVGHQTQSVRLKSSGTVSSPSLRWRLLRL